MGRVIKTSEDYGHDFDIDLDDWRRIKPHGISGVFRFKDESEFGLDAIRSHARWLDEIVVVLNNSDDATKDMLIGQDFGIPFRAYEYPFDLAQIKTKRHDELPENSVHSMVHYTNWALSRAWFSWVAKIEGDVIALSSFQRIRNLVDANPHEQMYYGRYGLNLAGLDGKLFDYDTPRNAGWDEGVCNNNPDLYRCVKHGPWESIDFHDKPKKNMGFSFMHVKRCKRKYQSYSKDQRWRTFNRTNVEEALRREAENYQGPDGICPDVLFEPLEVSFHA